MRQIGFWLFFGITGVVFCGVLRAHRDFLHWNVDYDDDIQDWTYVRAPRISVNVDMAYNRDCVYAPIFLSYRLI